LSVSPHFCFERWTNFRFIPDKTTKPILSRA
jgi:hypothetical protein